MYYLSIGAVFKNEALGLEEWLQHYINRGVEHFYLINDNSTDNWKEIIDKYEDKLTIFNNDIPKIINGNINKNRQEQIYNKYLTPILHNTQYILIVDLDEYVYSPDNKKISTVISKYNCYSQIKIEWLMFGSNGYITQPDGIRKKFTKRSNIIYSYKSLIKTSDVVSLGIHFSNVRGNTIHLHIDSIFHADLICNHYRVQSLEYWKEIQMKRGDVNCHESETWRDLDIFNRYNHNEVEDMRLSNQTELDLE
jgi:hypothetical protein